MRFKTGFVISEIGGKTVAVSVGAGEADYRGMVTLNSTGKFIWLLVEDGADRERIYSRLHQVYGIEYERAKADADVFLDKLVGAGIIAD